MYADLTWGLVVNAVQFKSWQCSFVPEFSSGNNKSICSCDWKVVCEMVDSCCQYCTNDWANPVDLEECTRLKIPRPLTVSFLQSVQS